MGRLNVICWVAALTALASPALAQEVAAPQADAQPAAELVDQRQGEAYNRFAEGFRRMVGRAGEEFQEKYELSAERAEELNELLRDQAETFLDVRGMAMFALQQKGEALRDYMRENELPWEAVDSDIRQELMEEALVLVEAVAEQYGAWADRAEEVLDGRSLALLRRDRLQAETAMRTGIMQLRVMAGKDVPQGVGVVQPPPAPARPDRLTIRAGLDELKNAWQRYVEQFCQRHALDEVQKLRAQEVLAKHMALLAEAKSRNDAQAATQPASTQPTTQAGDEGGGFAARLRASGARGDAARLLFADMVKELEKIPTPAQRRLAQGGQAPAPAAEPATRPQ